jgi:GT2 family glycosyltransferase
LHGGAVTVIIPTLAADGKLCECLEGLGRQTRRDFDVVVVDNSGKGLARQQVAARPAVRVIENKRNLGFGGAINQAIGVTDTTFIATLNDDAVPHPRWLETLLAALDGRPDAGMAASQVRFYGEDCLDSAGMLMCGDGSSRQRGHGKPPDDFPVAEEVLFPSGSAALYRRRMLEGIGGFDEGFFLYCEDTDLGLRARWAGWKCLYVPQAVVEHRYSHSAGRASPLKAYYVERNRLFVLAKNFPLGMLSAAPWVAVQRYFWHAWHLLRGNGAAARFRAEGHATVRLPLFILRAHLALLWHGPRLWRQRRSIRAQARITPAVFRHLVRSHSISARKVAAL